MIEVIERAVGGNLLDFVQAIQSVAPDIGARAIACADGIAAFTGADSPLTVVKGAGPEIRDDDIDEAEAFFRNCGAENASFELAPWVSRSCVHRLEKRGYAKDGAEDIVSRLPPFDAPEPCHPVRPVSTEDWTDLIMTMYGVPDTPTWRAISAGSAVLPDALRFGVRDQDGNWIACAELIPVNGMALFANDATLAQARCRGAQTATIHERLRTAASRNWNCTIAEVALGSGSERNYLRCGFAIAYTRAHYARRL